jgi:RNA polymerase sigma-70 factor (ECF subfamily)
MDREGDFRDLFADHYARVVRTVFWILQDWDRSEEVTQDAFVQLLRHWDRVADHDQPDAWVRRVAIRLAVQTSKREQRLAAAVLRGRPPTPATQTLEDPMSGDVLAAVRQLPPKQRAAVALRYFEDKPVEEIAQLMECSPSTARVHLHRARQRLAQTLGEEVGSDVR